MPNDFYNDEGFLDDETMYRDGNIVLNDGHLSWSNSTLVTGIMSGVRDPNILVLELAITDVDGQVNMIRLDKNGVDTLLQVLFTYKVAIS